MPKRGIGATTLNRVQEYADAHDISFYNALRGAEEITTLGRAASEIKPFVMFIQSMRSKSGNFRRIRAVKGYYRADRICDGIRGRGYGGSKGKD